MRILMCNSFNYLRGGSERCFLELSALLAQNGHEVIPFCMDHPNNLPSPYSSYFVSSVDFPAQVRGETAEKKSKVQVAERVIYSQEARKKVEDLIKAARPDVAHIHCIAHEISPSILPVIKRAGIPIVQTLHDYKLLCPNTNFVSHGQMCERCKGNRYYNVVRYRCKRGSASASLLACVEMYVHRILRIYERNVDVFVSPSRFLQRKVTEYGIRNPVVNIPNFIDLKEFRPSYEPEDYFVFVGRLENIKGIRTLLKAMREISFSHLYVAGGGELEEWARAFAAENNIQNVTFMGHLDTNRLKSVVQRALFTVVPSECYENYPMSILESFACGTAVIGSRIGGIPELVRDGHTGLLFEPGNEEELTKKVRYLLEHRQKAIEMGRVCRQQVERINDPQQHYQQTMRIYEGLVAA